MRQLNRVPYQASFFGEKLHFDQNEKLNMYSVVHVLAIDGYSRKIVGFVTIQKKNPIMIYDLLFCPILLEYGVWDQLRMDQGTEFNLVISVQYTVANFHNGHHRQSVIQSTSRLNHRTERIWPMINARINYPIKRVLTELENNGFINLSDDTEKFCTSPIRLYLNQFKCLWTHGMHTLFLEAEVVFQIT